MPIMPQYRSPYGQSILELLAGQGDAAARAAERSGMIWANAVQNLGQIGAQAYEQHQQQKDQQKREALIDEAFATYNPTKPAETARRLALAGGSRFAVETMRAISAGQQLEKAPTPEAAKLWIKGIAAQERLNPGYLFSRRDSIGPQIQKYGEMFGMPVDAIGEDIGQRILAVDDSLSSQTEQAGFTLGPDQVRFDASGKQIAAGPPKPVTPEKTLADIQAEAEARARGTRLGNPPQPPQPRDESVGRVLAQAWAEGRSFPTKGDDVSAALVYMDKHPEEFPNKPRKLSAPQQDKVLSTTATLDRLDATIAAYQKVKSKVGPVTYTLNEWERRIPGTAADPDFITFNTNLRQLGNLEIRDITGAAMAVQEAERLLKGMATGDLKPADFEAAVAVMRQNAQRIRDVTLYGRVLGDAPRAEADDSAGWGEWQSVGGGRARKKVKR